MKNWSSELKELTNFHKIVSNELPSLEAELGKLLEANDEVVVLLYSRRCLELIVNDICESEAIKLSSTIPLKAIVDKLNKEEKAPSHIISSMLNLNNISTYGAHPKDFDPRQVRTVLINLTTIMDWYITYKGFGKKEIPGVVNKKSEIAPTETTIPKKKSIIVLPFENMSPDPDQEYFSDGLTEEIITDLSHIHDLLVISRSSAMTFKGTRSTISEIAKKVNVQYVLEGSIRKAGNNLRITAQLINAENDSHLWAEKYNGTLDDIFDIQEKVSQSIVAALKLKLSEEEKQIITDRPFIDVKAYEYYLKARQEIDTFTESGIKRAIKFLESALKIVRENDVLYAGLGYAWLQYFNLVSKQEYLDNGLKYAGEALRLNPDSSEGHFVTGHLFTFFIPGSIKRGLKHLKQALEIDPNNCEALFHLGVVSLFLGKTTFVAAIYEKQISIDPLSFYGYWVCSIFHLFDGRTEQALEPMGQAHDLAPSNPAIDFFYALVLMFNGKLDEAFSIVEESTKKNPDNIFTSLGIFMRYTLQGKKIQALQSVTPEILKWSSNDLTNPFYIVAGYSLIGEKEEALNWLEKWINLGCINYPFLSKYNTFLENIRGEERFRKLMEQVKYEWENFEI